MHDALSHDELLSHQNKSPKAKRKLFSRRVLCHAQRSFSTTQYSQQLVTANSSICRARYQHNYRLAAARVIATRPYETEKRRPPGGQCRELGSSGQCAEKIKCRTRNIDVLSMSTYARLEYAQSCISTLCADTDQHTAVSRLASAEHCSMGPVILLVFHDLKEQLRSGSVFRLLVDRELAIRHLHVYLTFTRSEFLPGYLQYNTIQYKTCNAPYVTGMLFVGAGMTRD